MDLGHETGRKFSFSDILMYFLVALVIVGILVFLGRMNQGDGYSYASVRRLFLREEVDRFLVDGNDLTVWLKEPLPDGSSTLSYRLASVEQFHSDLGDLIGALELPGWVSSLLPVGAMMLFMVGFGFIMLRRRDSAAGGGGDDRAGRFGRARARTLAGEDNTVSKTPSASPRWGRACPRGCCWSARRVRARP